MLRERQTRTREVRGLSLTHLGCTSSAIEFSFRIATYERRPVVQTEYLGVSLGVNKEEVLYRRGEPTSVYRERIPQEDESNPIFKGTLILDNPGGKYPEGKTVRDYDYWVWELPYEGQKEVSFKENKVVRISCFGGEGKSCDPTLGIGTGYSEEQVTDRLGQPTTSELSFGSFREFEYHDLNAVIGFTMQKATKFQIEEME